MPCRDWDTSTSYEDLAQRRRADKLARIACELARCWEKEGKSLSFLSKETRDWWADHKEADRKREEAEAKARRIRKIKQDAIKKLTPEERKALGV